MSAAMNETILTNARILCSDRDLHGTVVVEDGCITDVLPRRVPEGIDLHGAFLMPGIIDIHSDYLERELAPRPTARIPLELAMHVTDLRALSSGLTTVATAARIAEAREGRGEGGRSARNDGLQLARRFEDLAPQMRVRHVIHIRWSTNFEPDDAIFEELLQLKTIGNIVFNDDAPGQRQFRDVEALIQQHATRRNISLDEARQWMEERKANAGKINNRQTVKSRLGNNIPLGSHDDTTVEHVLEAFDAGCTLSEMPCSIEAARKAKELGMMVCMGAPNYYRGGSHCGNLGCHGALAEDLVDIICSDYHFPSMLASLMRMAEEGMTLSAAANLFTLNPARHLRMDDTIGSIAPGKRADMVAFHHHNGFGDVERVWVGGELRFSSSIARHTAGQVKVSETQMLEAMMTNK
jgi:alpha-D-ribose 1-methylphosphonate 5-triphosphate diphosphatase